MEVNWPEVICPMWGFFCDGQRIEREGTNEQDWKACGRSCQTNSACKFWHFFLRNVKDGNPIFPNKCFLYTDCKFKMDRNSPAQQNVAGNKNCAEVTDPSRVFFKINYKYCGNFSTYL